MELMFQPLLSAELRLLPQTCAGAQPTLQRVEATWTFSEVLLDPDPSELVGSYDPPQPIPLWLIGSTEAPPTQAVPA